MRISSLETAGPTRRVRTGLNAEVHEALSATHRGSPEFVEFLREYRPFFRTRVFDPQT
jgi:hypothetical protein